MDMEKVKTNIKRFFSNPNTLTFILVLVLIVVIYLVYSRMVNKAIAPVTVPYCTQEIKTMKEITDEYIGSVKISGNFVTANGSGLNQSTRNVKGKYVAPGYFVPANSFFYSDALTDESIAAKTDFSDIRDGDTIYNLKVDFHSTYGNSIMPGNRIDLYFYGYDKQDNSRLLFGLFIKSIEVLKVVDQKGLDVFTESEENEPKPAGMYFAVPDEINTLLKVIENAPGTMGIIPVPRNANYSESPEDTSIANETIKSFIEQYASTMQ